MDSIDHFGGSEDLEGSVGMFVVGFRRQLGVQRLDSLPETDGNRQRERRWSRTRGLARANNLLIGVS